MVNSVSTESCGCRRGVRRSGRPLGKDDAGPILKERTEVRPNGVGAAKKGIPGRGNSISEGSE